MKSILKNLQSLGKPRLIGLGIVGASIFLSLIIGLSIITKPTFTPVYSGLSPSEASGIVRTLENSGIQVEISADSSVVSIPQGDIARARMTLAENGLPSSGSPGWELFDEGGGMGMNTFQQRINRLRAMEGELARSIQTINGVEAARVHLVLPEREAFSRERATPSASVIIRTSASFALEKKQALAIRHLVSAAVPNLAANRVAVMTADGEVLASEDSEGFSSDNSVHSTKAAKEDRYSQAITEILTARVGAGNARVNVSVDLSTKRKVVVSESFNPEEQVVRSTETMSENEEDIDGGDQNVSVANNLPENLLDNNTATGGTRSARNRSNEIINYEIGSTRSETVYEPGEVEKISVAVLVNGIFERGDGGDVAYKDRDTDELARLEELVKTAIGFSEERGDSVSVDSLRFMDYSMDVGEPVSASIADILTENIMTIIKWFFVAVVIGLVMSMGVRPALLRVLPANDSDDDTDTVDFQTIPEPSTANDQGQAEKGTQDADSEGDDDLVDISSVSGGVRKRRITAVSELVQNDKAEAVKVLRAWISTET